MKAQEIRNMTETEIQEKLRDSKTELFNLRFQHAAGQLENAHRISMVKKDIARLLTVIALKEYEEEVGFSKKKSTKPKKASNRKSRKEPKTVKSEPTGKAKTKTDKKGVDEKKKVSSKSQKADEKAEGES